MLLGNVPLPIDLTMACHPSGIVVDVAGLNASSDGCTCEEHECCGTAAPDVAVRFKCVQIARDVVDEANPETKATAIGVCHSQKTFTQVQGQV